MNNEPFLEFEDYPSTDTPLSATNLNNMQISIANSISANTDNIGDLTNLTTTDKTDLVSAINNVNNSSNYIVAGMTSDQSLSNNVVTTLNLSTTINSKGTLLTLDTSSHGVVVGAGVHNIEVSGQYYQNALNGSGARNIYIYKNDTQISRALIVMAAAYQTVGVQPMIIPVQESDVIYLKANSQGGTATVSYSNVATFLSVKVID